MKKLKDDLFQIIDSAINSVKPDQLIPRKVMLEGSYLLIDTHKINLDRYENIYIVGTGKASASMAHEFEKILESKIADGIISTKYGHSIPCSRIKIIESGHPVLDENGLKAGDEILKLVSEANENDLVICLLSGGGSALLEKLPDEITLSELQSVFKALLKCGANIEEMNIVRRHLSKIKGGKLSEAIYPATCVSLILSDVINDPLEAISGGVTSPDPSTFQDALNVLAKYKIKDQIPDNILEYISMGAQGSILETVKPGNEIFKNVTNIILGNNKEALIHAKEKAETFGYNVLIRSDNIQGEARDIGKLAADIAKKINRENQPISKPACVLIGGETTVKIKGNGKGGRNQELALSALIEMNYSEFDYLIASCGTDGTDGPTDAAGAIASNEIWQRTNELNLLPLQFLDNNDSYTFFEKTGGLIITGPTGTNVMDIIIILVN
ncbi:MAG: glycerate kinase [Melioribacteraceae bacterium]|nr:glycerate kinase [Melioribacteraceae bacterium]